MMIIKVEDQPIFFSELKAGDIFSFVNTPGNYFIKTDKDYSIGGDCNNCYEEFSFDLVNYCVNLKTGKFYEAGDWEKVIVYKNTELTLK